MQTYFPPSISFSKITSPMNGRLYAHFAFSLVFALDNRIQMPDDIPFLLTEEDPASTVLDPASAWPGFIQSLDKDSFLDYGMPKLYSEWLMAGSTYAKGQKAVSVNVNVGTLSRDFFVVGDSHDTGIDMIDPAPFEKMPLTWANTYGGKAHSENPSGKGMDKDSFGILHLPNVYEKSSIGHNTQKIPACPQGKHVLSKGFHSQMGFQTFPKGMGTYDDAWLKNLFPAPPKDFDWKYYNLAQPQQIMPSPASQGAVFKALDKIRITNMHEEYAELVGQIPPYNLRFFVEYTENPSINIDAKIPHIAKDRAEVTGFWREIQTQADTLWLLPNQNMAVLMWHASIPTQSEAHIDILSFASYLEYALAPQKDARECIAIAIAQKEGLEVKADEASAEPEEDEATKLDLSIPKAPAFVAGAAVLADKTSPLVVAADSEADSEAEAQKVKEEEEKAEQEMQAFTDETIEAGVALANEELKKLGLDVEISADDVQAKMAELSTQLDALSAKIPEEPAPEDVLAQLGLSPEQIDAVKKVSELEIPFEGDFASLAEYNTAFEAYASQVALTFGAPSEFVSSIMENTSALEMLQEKGAGVTEANSNEFVSKLLTDAGLPESEANTLINALQTPVPEDASQESLMEYYQAFDKAMTSSSDINLASVGSEQINQMRIIQYGAGQESINEALKETVTTIPEGQEKAFTLFQSKLLEISPTNPLPPDTDLVALAMACGVSSPALLTSIYEVDPMPFKAAPPSIAVPQNDALKAAKIPSAGADAPQASPAEAISAGASPVAETAPKESPVEPAEPADEEYQTPTNAEEFKQALIDEVDLTSHDLSGIDLTGLDISMLSATSLALCANLSLEGANLENAKLTKANFSKAQLTGANLTGTDFSECDLTGTNLSTSTLQNTIFDKAILDKALFEESPINQCSFNASSALSSSWNKVEITDTSFMNANLSESLWVESTMRQLDMTTTCLSHASFEASLLESCQLQGDLTRLTIIDSSCKDLHFDAASLNEARFYSSKFIDCTFNQAHLSKSNWSLVSAENSSMEKANINDADFEECAFKNLQASFVSAKNAKFQSCDLTNANMLSLNLFKGSLRDCLVANANFTNANLYDADLYLMRPDENTKFDGADLTNTILTRSI